MMWPFRLFVRDRDDPSQLHAYFSGCQGRHADIYSTLAGERFEQARSELGWESFGAWGYKNLQLGSEKYQPIRGTTTTILYGNVQYSCLHVPPTYLGLLHYTSSIPPA